LQVFINPLGEELMERCLKSRSVLKGLVITVFTIALIAGAAPAWAEEVQQISPDEVKKMIESKKTDFLIVDVQPKGVYDLGHIKGAVNFPWEEDLKSPGKLPKNKLLILYCDCAHEEDSTSTATQLKQKWGYTKVKALQGGWSGWVKLGYPTQKVVKK
jgi:rhodanese-related sulfurtransferase